MQAHIVELLCWPFETGRKVPGHRGPDKATNVLRKPTLAWAIKGHHRAAHTH